MKSIPFNPPIWAILIIISIALFISPVSAVEDWTISGNSVYIDTNDVYIAVNPHTLTQSGFITLDITSKHYTGNIDFAFLMNESEGVKPTSADLWIDGNEFENVEDLFTKYAFSYDGTDTAYLGTNLPVVAEQDYSLRVWIEMPPGASGKYGVALKPSHLTLSEAQTAGYFYYLDPWYDGLTNLLDNPDFEDWTAGAPDDWTFTGTGVAVSQESTLIKNGTYSVKVTSRSTAAVLLQYLANPTTYRGKVITLGAWVYAEEPNVAIIQLLDGTNYPSTSHSGTPGWEWLTVSMKVDVAATIITVRSLRVESGSEIVYVDNAIVVEGFIYENVDHEGEDYTIPSTDEAMGGNHYNIGTFTVNSGAVLYLQQNTSLTISAERIIIDGKIDGNGSGKAGGAVGVNGESPGGGVTGGASGDIGGGGGAYGGDGGNGGDYYGPVPGGLGGSAHGSATTVTNTMGGGGAGGAADPGSAGANGGGQVTLNANYISISGSVYMNGDATPNVGAGIGCGGAGAGGGILINGSEVILSGTISANGGKGGNAGLSAGGGGSGGRIKVFYLNYTNTSTMTATAGLGGTGGNADGNGINGDDGTTYTLRDTTNLLIFAPYGYVYTEHGVVIPDANVTISNDTWSQILTTNSLGYWSATELVSTGIYEHEVSVDYRINDDGYVYASASATNSTDFTLPLDPPMLYTPVDVSEVSSPFPPLTHDVTFYWENTGAAGYKIEIAEDENFNILTSIDTITYATTTKTLLFDVEYFWRVSGWDEASYGNPSDVYSFTLNGTSTLSGSAIEGVVYTGITGAFEPIDNAQVSITNGTWSSSAVTGSNGYYAFTGLLEDDVYQIWATKDLYLSSASAYVNVSTDPIIQNFYLEQDRTSQEWWHYVSFELRSFFGTLHSDVDVVVYKEDSIEAFNSGTTGTDGTITFHLDQNIEYRITFINASQSINQEFIVYPISNNYVIFTDTFSYQPPEPVSNTVSSWVEGIRINGTHGYINFSWVDTSSELSTIDYWISDEDGNILYHTQENTNDMMNSQIVEATDDRYVVRYYGDHATLGTVDNTETIAFHAGRRISLGWGEDWMYAVASVGFLIFIGTLFGAKTAQYGAMSVVVMSWIFMWIGWLNTTNTSAILLMLATILAVGWTLRKGENQR